MKSSSSGIGNQISNTKLPSSSTSLTQNNKPDHNFKILLIGNSGVGKSSILMRYSQNKFMQNYYSTIGVDYKLKYLKLKDKNIKLQIWDTAGQDRFKTIVSSYYRGANGILIIYDVSDRSSFEGVKMWLNQIEKLSQQTVVKYLVGNKNDLQEKRQVTFQQGKMFSNISVVIFDLGQQLKIGFKQTSARLATNIDEIFIEMTEEILGWKKQSQNQITFIPPPVKDQNVHKLVSQKPKQKQSSSCC